MTLTSDVLDTPVGALVLVYEGDALVHVDFADNHARRDAQLRKRYGRFVLAPRAKAHPVLRAFRRYFDGDTRALDGLDVELSPGGTPTQQKVWRALRRIPVGKTTSYGALAARVGMAGAARAVGRINGQNPLGVIVPCHRVVGASGALTGYAAGVERKAWLLAHEAR